MSEQAERCDGCQFWMKAEQDDIVPSAIVWLGHCRRYPPTRGRLRTKDGDITAHEFPVTYEFEWCGEHKPKPAALT
jgi:hypothetical protein